MITNVNSLGVLIKEQRDLDENDFRMMDLRYLTTDYDIWQNLNMGNYKGIDLNPNDGYFWNFKLEEEGRH